MPDRYSIRGLVIACCALQLAGAGWFGDRLYHKTEEGNRNYHNQAYEKAMQSYTEAQIEDPDSLILHYNLGNVLYQQGAYETAIAEFEQVVSADDPVLAALAYYNLGNACFRLKKYDTAIEHYKNALLANPRDEDAKFNLELARRFLKSGPSERAKELYREVLELVRQRQYGEAWQRTQEALQEEETFVTYGDFIQRVRELATLFAGMPEKV